MFDTLSESDEENINKSKIIISEVSRLTLGELKNRFIEIETIHKTFKSETALWNPVLLMIAKNQQTSL